ncbi:ABC transporter ATP-binding protein [Labrys monachus]|uniref:2-aminoethylphosphonate transport system ATP-binding protein n=1 Tax=Labrys monachus TaxID=217067 RepID=A0ABU0FB50_9HYPH|nr:ABC transporter ATP-binding protein [Labrys monachus]MDQ0391841.1 2-aminoethylphosphonate transport system ATP-binding protein [Labrys monachus]
MTAASLSMQADAQAGAATQVAAPAAGSRVGFDEVTIAYGASTIVDRLTLDIDPGEILALIGPSGSGKTTALRALAGFVRPVAGRLTIGDTDVTRLPPYARGIGMVVQNYALFPHMKVEENVAFGLDARGTARDIVRERVASSLRMVGMLDFMGRYPRQLSGGQQQRVAIARALAIRPRVLLLDEPLSALDAQIRRTMVEELAKLHRELPGLTVLYVTHDQAEALTLADRIAIMRGGRLAAHAPSNALYRRPPNRFAAEFLGRANLLDVSVAGHEQGTPFMRVRFGAGTLLAAAHPQMEAGAKALLCVRPHDLVLRRDEIHCNAVTGTVQAIQWQGDLHALTVEVGGNASPVRVVSAPLREPPAPGTTVELYFAAEDATLIADEAA